MKETKNVFSKDPPATVIQIPAANASRSLTEPLLETHEKGHPQQHQLSSMEPTESDSQSSYGGGDDVTAEATGFKKSNDFDDKPQTLNVSYGGGLLSDLTSNKLDDTVGTFLRHGSMAALLVWMVLLVTALLFTPAESFERLEGVERNANITVLVLLLYTNISRIARMVIRDKGFRFVNSGVMVGYATVQTIAVISISLMVFFPTPVIIDPVTGIRTHLVRWAEWTAAGFLMTFLVESVDLPVSTMEHQHVDKSKRHRNIPMIAWMHGIAIGVSTAAGAVSAFCTSWNAWLAVIGFSWILFCSLFVRLYQRHHRVRNMSPGVCIEEKEDYDRAKYSLKTITVCTLIWTGLAGSWTVIALVTPFVPSESIFSNPALMLVSESLFESISKIWYADLLIEIHEIVFDDAARTMRRLEELRNLMTAVWDHSSDILIWGSRSSRGDSLIQGIVSPRGGDFLGVNSSTPINGKCPSTLLIEVDPDAKQYRCCLVDLSAPITREGAISLRNSKLQEQDKACSFTEFDGNNNVAVIVDLLCEAHCMEFHQEKTTVRNLVSREQGNLRQCEAKISKLASSDSTLIVIRDISERFERFEAEKKLIEEKTARRKDFEANRFTRHEIKNGVLAAIGLVECLKDGTNTNRWSQSIGDGFPDETESITIPIPSTTHTVQRSGDQVRERELDLESISACMDDSYSAGLSAREDSYGELDNTLRDILDTIMDHAMSLDVINGEYDVRKERVDVPFILSNIKRQTTVGPSQRRFQIVSCKEPFPTLGLDPRLLRHIYQNALSNAIRYGKRNGDIQTVIDYDENKREFKMDVINEPGPGHGNLTLLSSSEVDANVFSQGSRLVFNSFEEGISEIQETNSSGDGCWIMRKCSNVMNGDIQISFEANRTVLSFRCPARIIGKTDSRSQGPREFTQLPQNTWGIVVDDSGIQRKLMDRFLNIAGVEKDRRIILGKDSDEIFNFTDRVIEILSSNPNDKVLLIADENLDVMDGGALNTTVSGSLSVERMLKKLETSEERRLLALVRSANDSSTELSLYKSRAHGFLPKAPIDKNGVLSVIQPWWVKRFAHESTEESTQESIKGNSCISLESDCYDPYHDIVELIEVIAALCRVGSSTSLRNRWRTISDRLLVLKGDLKSMTASREEGGDFEAVLTEIDSLRSGSFPRDLRQRWLALETKLYKTINANR